MCIKRKETTHVEVGEEDIHHIYIYISKISTKYVNMVTRLVYKKLKEAKLPKQQGGKRSP